MRRVVAAFFVLIGLGSLPGQAQAGDVFTVRAIRADATARSASEARTVAVADGQRAALDVLLRRLTRAQDWSYLPMVDQELAQSWVRGFQVGNEKTSSTRYIADLTVSFQAEQVRNLLRARSIPFSESQAKQALLLPVLQRGTVTLFWDDPNPWRTAWEGVDLTNALVPMTLPLGDIDDLTSLTVEQALAGDEATLLALAARYGTDQVMVAKAAVNDAQTQLSVTLTRYGSGGIQRTARTVSGAGDLPDLLKTGADAMMELLSERWKQGTIVRGAEGARISTSVRFAGLPEWQTIRRRLGRVSIVRNTQIVAVSSEGAQLEFDYSGTLDTLALSLAQQNLQLSAEQDYWVLSLVR